MNLKYLFLEFGLKSRTRTRNLYNFKTPPLELKKMKETTSEYWMQKTPLKLEKSRSCFKWKKGKQESMEKKKKTSFRTRELYINKKQ